MLLRDQSVAIRENQTSQRRKKLSFIIKRKNGIIDNKLDENSSRCVDTPIS